MMRCYAAWVMTVLTVVGLFALAYVEMHEPARSPAPSLALGRQWQVADVTRIEILHGKDALMLERQGDHTWRLGGKPADAQAVQQLLEDLKQMQVERIVAWNAAHDRELGLDDAEARDVRLYASDGSMLWQCRIGRQARDLTSTYLRVQGDDRALAVDRALRWQVLRTPDIWLAKAKSGPSQPSAKSAEGASSHD